jgi:hypothetical protein
MLKRKIDSIIDSIIQAYIIGTECQEQAFYTEESE